MMGFYTFMYAICTVLMIRGCNSEIDLDALPRVTRPYFPIIPDTTHHKAMEKLKELWVTQAEYLKTIKQAALDIKNATRYAVAQLGWIYNDTIKRIEQNIQVLSDVPWKNNTEEMKEALDDDTIWSQRRSWDGMEKCLNDHYEYQKKDEHEKLFRKTVETAREDLLRRQTEIKALVKEKIDSAKS